jgi:uncharacterized protein YacL
MLGCSLKAPLNNAKIYVFFNTRVLWPSMSESKLKEFSRDKLPWFYKLILKIPGTDFLESSGGIFWGIIIPIFMTMEFFLSLFLLLLFPFPINVFLAGIIPIAILIIFIKISLERFINWWNSVFRKSYFELNIEKTVQEYLNLLKKKEKKNEQ